jgi:hypothetical protein
LIKVAERSGIRDIVDANAMIANASEVVSVGSELESRRMGARRRESDMGTRIDSSNLGGLRGNIKRWEISRDGLLMLEIRESNGKGRGLFGRFNLFRI